MITWSFSNSIETVSYYYHGPSISCTLHWMRWGKKKRKYKIELYRTKQLQKVPKSVKRYQKGAWLNENTKLQKVKELLTERLQWIPFHCGGDTSTWSVDAGERLRLVAALSVRSDHPATPHVIISQGRHKERLWWQWAGTVITRGRNQWLASGQPRETGVPCWTH